MLINKSNFKTKVIFQITKQQIVFLISLIVLSACSVNTVQTNNIKPVIDTTSSKNKSKSSFRIYPYVQNPTESAISILWFSESAESGTITYRKQDSEETTEVKSMSDEMSGLAW